MADLTPAEAQIQALQAPLDVPSGDLLISEIWDSAERLQAYGEVLMPILADAGLHLSGEPEVFQVHNIIRR